MACAAQSGVVSNFIFHALLYFLGCFPQISITNTQKKKNPFKTQRESHPVLPQRDVLRWNRGESGVGFSCHLCYLYDSQFSALNYSFR